MKAQDSNFDFDTLYEHQAEFLNFAQDLRHVFCGDDMGLGKTYMGIALDAVRRYQQQTSNGALKGTKTLVVAPLSGVLDSWVRHFKKLAPNLVVRRVDTTNKESRLSLIGDIEDPGVDVICIHWEALQERLGLLGALKGQWWLHIIADEAHRAKNRKAKQTQGLKAIKKVNFKTGMTGTPMKNRPDDAWSIIDWLYNGKAERKTMWPERVDERLFSSYWNFYDEFIQWFDAGGYRQMCGTRNEDRFRDLIKPFYIRRTKDEVLSLPDKYYSVREVDLPPEQRRPYDAMARDMLAWLGEQGDKPLAATVVIAQMIRLQQMALARCKVQEITTQHEDEGHIWEETAIKVVGLERPSAKLDALLEVADELGDQKLVVFSQFSKMIDMAHAELDKEGYNVAKLTGGTAMSKRSEMIREFQEGDTQILLCTIGAGGVGIDLYAASTCVFLDRAWSPADNQQAEDRLHRIGQTNNVHIIDIVAKNTIDRERGVTIQTKASWIKNMLLGREEE